MPFQRIVIRHHVVVRGAMSVAFAVILGCVSMTCTTDEARRVEDLATSALWSGGKSETGLQLRADRVGTDGNFMLINTRMTSVRLLSIQPTDVDGLEIIGIQIHTPGPGMVGTSDTYPPYPQSALAAVRDYEVGASGPPEQHEVQVVVGVRLSAGHTTGRLSGFNVTFVDQGTRYVLHTEQKLEVRQL